MWTLRFYIKLNTLAGNIKISKKTLSYRWIIDATSQITHLITEMIKFLAK